VLAHATYLKIYHLSNITLTSALRNFNTFSPATWELITMVRLIHA